MGNLSNLALLAIDGNQLTGEIPPELGNLSNLTILHLNDNQLTGAIPPELSKIANLGVLRLNHNYLTGAIPLELGNNLVLRELHLHGNRLTGCIPAYLRSAPSTPFAPLSEDEVELLGLPICDASVVAPTPVPTPTPTADQLTEQCSNGVAVPNPADNPGLVSDCAALLAARDALAGVNGYLSWSPDISVSDWDGVTIDNNRVSELRLSNYDLNGEIPAALGNLDQLSRPWISSATG